MTSKKAVPYKSLKSEIVTAKHSDHIVWQIQSNKHNGVVEFRYDAKACPNEMAILNHNHQTENVNNKAHPNNLPGNATYCSFKISTPYTVEQFSEQASEMVAKKIIPEIIDNLRFFPFKTDEKPSALYLYPAEKNDRYLNWMANAAEKTDLPISITKVQIGGKDFVEGIALQLK